MSVEIELPPQEIVVMDDNKNNLYVVQELLSDMNVNIHCVETPDEFFKTINEQDVDLIIMDIHMPEIDGFEIIKMYKEEFPENRAPIIFLTAQYGDSESVLKGLSMGAIDYLTKPIDNRVFSKKVEVFLRESRVHKQLENREKVYKKMLRQLRFH